MTRINTRSTEEFACLDDVLNPRRFNVDSLKSRGDRLLPIVTIRQSAGNATPPHPQSWPFSSFGSHHM